MQAAITQLSNIVTTTTSQSNQIRILSKNELIITIKKSHNNFELKILAPHRGGYRTHQNHSAATYNELDFIRETAQHED